MWVPARTWCAKPKRSSRLSSRRSSRDERRCSRSRSSLVWAEWPTLVGCSTRAVRAPPSRRLSSGLRVQAVRVREELRIESARRTGYLVRHRRTRSMSNERELACTRRRLSWVVMHSLWPCSAKFLARTQSEAARARARVLARTQSEAGMREVLRRFCRRRRLRMLKLIRVFDVTMALT